MVQVLATIFFSAAAISALGVIATAFAEDFDVVRTALGVGRPSPKLHSIRARARQIDLTRVAVTARTGVPLRAAA